MKQKDAAHIVMEMFEDMETHSRSGMVVKDAEIAFLLAVTADLLDIAPCGIAECEGCDLIHTIWWGWCNDLSGPTRIKMQAHLRACGIALPPGPVEVTPTDDLSTARN